MHAHAGDNPDRDGRYERMLARAFWLIAGFTAVEIVGAVIGNSLTLAADAGHMFLDATALGLSWFAMRLSRRAATNDFTYGYHRFQVLAAFVNGLALLALCAWIVYEAVGRLRAPEAILPLPVLAVALVGLVVNIFAYRMLHGTDNLNVRSAALHVLGDLLGSVAAITSALAALAFGVAAIHNVHAWALTNERPMLTLHATVEGGADVQSTLERIKSVLKAAFDIHHSTVQLEHGDCADSDRHA